MYHILSRKKWLSHKHFSKYTTDAPNINCRSTFEKKEPHNSGARYHLDCSFTVQNIADGVSSKDTRARPKSQILTLQSALARMFLGLRSRWKTLAA
ncbi:Os01g0643825 [Oryza sativa Japonica Group]|uniref:Os01g0643825 protein n=1 Tax=Oryza sativa subsp. japonica TaxID=39947 RepID=A0A0N7KDE4_ORYSJ|nr:hypothetical protein EE612_004628 [Oryza sativa]BAS73385.1 Os01g0643825 [Oryza sativa Japonica Group]